MVSQTGQISPAPLSPATGPMADDVLDHVSDAVLFLTGGEIRGANSAARALFWGSVDDLRKAGLARLLEPGDPVDMSTAQARSLCGAEVPVSVRVVPVTGGQTVILRNLTCEHQLEAYRSDIDAFLQALSHDLRAPLRAISHLSDWISEDMDSAMGPESREDMRILKSRTRRMERLLDALIAYGGIGIPARAPDVTVVSGARIEDTLRSSFDLPEGFRLSVTDDFRALAMPDAPLTSMLKILLDNALRHHDRIHGEITLDGRDDGGAIRITMTDDGPGIPPEFQTAIFDLCRGLRSFDETGGCGMGLAILRKELAGRGGRVELQSPLTDRGSRFILHWPLADGKLVTESPKNVDISAQ